MSPLSGPKTPALSAAFRTVGCRLNQCETAQMQEGLAAEGYQVVDWRDRADVRVVNTCTVTGKSDRTCRHEIHAAKRLDPACFLVVTGCLAQIDPESVAAMPEVDLVLGNPQKSELASSLATALATRARGATDAANKAAEVVVSAPTDDWGSGAGVFTRFHGRTRAFLKVQTGCDSRCAYCIVPLARGPARSMPAALVQEHTRSLSKNGYREVVLTGIDLGGWGKDSGEGSLADLVRMLLTDSPVGYTPLGRLRLSSVEPLEVTPALLDAVQDAGDRVAHHLHLPLQSGADSVLRRMARPYSAAQYLAVAREVAGRFPEMALGADVIVGFPGETEDEFQATLDLVEASPLAYLHVFAYSDRPGTAAQTMEPKITPEVIKERSARLRALGARKKESFRDRLTGSRQRVLVLEEQSPDGLLVGLTGNYMEVLVDHDDTLPNRFVQVSLDRPLSDGRWETTLLEREA